MTQQLLSELERVKAELARLREAAAPFTEPPRWRGSVLWRNRHGLRCLMSYSQIARDKLFYALNPDAPEYGDPHKPETLPPEQPSSYKDKDNGHDKDR